MYDVSRIGYFFTINKILQFVKGENNVNYKTKFIQADHDIVVSVVSSDNLNGVENDFIDNIGYL